MERGQLCPRGVLAKLLTTRGQGCPRSFREILESTVGRRQINSFCACFFWEKVVAVFSNQVSKDPLRFKPPIRDQPFHEHLPEFIAQTDPQLLGQGPVETATRGQTIVQTTSA